MQASASEGSLPPRQGTRGDCRPYQAPELAPGGVVAFGFRVPFLAVD